MKSSKINFNLLLGFVISIFLHVVVLILINSYENNKTVPTNKKDDSIKLSISMFKNYEVKTNEVSEKVEIKQEKKVIKKVTKTAKKAEQKSALHEEIEKKEIEKVDVFKEAIKELPKNNDEHYALIKKALEKHSAYPDKKNSFKEVGKTTVKFTLDKNGKIIDLWIFKSSGYSVFDKHALDIVNAASAHFPKLEEELTFTFNVSYN